MKCSKCGESVEVLTPEFDVGLGDGGACCVNEECEMFEVDVWDEFEASMRDEDGNPPKRKVGQ
jgi:hypothetical protein